MEWTQDISDYSWSAKDADGMGYRVGIAFDGNGTSRWALAWMESSGIPRISGRTFPTAEKAKAAANDIATPVAA